MLLLNFVAADYCLVAAFFVVDFDLSLLSIFAAAYYFCLLIFAAACCCCSFSCCYYVNASTFVAADFVAVDSCRCWMLLLLSFVVADLLLLLVLVAVEVLLLLILVAAYSRCCSPLLLFNFC